ncbi:phage tail length tape measure family protein [Massilia rhizosphaerae]|uniref:phage tail length tape measure family protein n=1 Tax=Massilia rhizosphaerae TaxID=2784389 RepID=UPI0018DB20F3|nr:phage tail length tape measure family protein [Massilia rhizosphaerae]
MPAAVTVGGLIINMAAETSQLKTDMAEGSRVVDAGAKAMINSLTGVVESSDRVTDAGARMVKQLRDEIATFGMTSQQLAQQKANLAGVGAEYEALTQRLNAMRSAQATFGQDVNATSTALRSHGAAAREAGGHVEEFGFRTAASKRELLVLAHELSQGNYKRFGGSMMVLAEQTGAAGALFSATGLAALGFAAAVVGVGAAVIKGAEDQRAMSNALIETGNYAGLTSDSLNALAHAAIEAGGSIGEAKKAVTALAASGKFTGAQIGYISDAAIAMEHAAGKSVDKTIEEFETLSVQTSGSAMRSSETISKAALKLDEQYHYLTESVYEEIRALEKDGDQKAASALATETLAKVTKDRAEEMVGNIGAIQRGWNSVKEVIGEVVDGLGKIGARNTVASDAAKASAKLASFDNGLKSVGITDPEHQLTGSWAETRKKLVLDLVAAYGKLNQADAAAIAVGKERMTQTEANLAASRIEQDNMRLGKKGLTELDEAIQRYGQDLAKIAAANPTSKLLDQDEVNRHMQMLMKAHTQTRGNDDRAALLQDRLTIEQTALDREKSIYDARGKMLDLYHSKFGMADAEFYAGREAARAEYVASEALAFAKEAALLKASEAQARNPQEVAAAKEKYDQLVKAHSKFVDDMRNAGGEDAVGAEASVKKQYDDLVKATVNAGAASIKSLDDQIVKQREHNAEIGKTKEQIELAKQAQVDAATAQMQSDADYLRDGMAKWALDDQSRALYEIRLRNLDDEIARRRTLAGLYADGADAEAIAKASTELDKFLDPTKAHNFGNALKGSLNGATKSMVDLTSAMMKYGAHQAANDKARAQAAILSKGNDVDQAKAAVALDAINRRSTQEQLAGYGNMASAAAGFFGEHSRGYQALMTVSQAFHAAELAMTMAELVPKAVSAVLTQGQGDPYTAFGRMAAMGALVAGLGVAIGGIGGHSDTAAKDRQAAQGTGTVLGDSSAKSESIKKVLDMVEKNTYQGLAINNSMLTTLRSIDSNIGSFAGQLVKSTNVTAPDVGNLAHGYGTTNLGAADMTATGAEIGSYWGPIGTAVGAVAGYIASKIPVFQNLFTSIVGGKQSVEDSGFGINPANLASLVDGGAHAFQYADINTSGGWFGRDKHSEQTTELNAAANQQFTAIIKSLAGSVKSAGDMLGLAGDDFTAKLNGFVVDVGHVSLKGLKGDELQKAVESVFAKLGDDMARYAVSGLQELQQVGEGYLETLVRVAAEYQTVDVVFQSFGKTFGAVGMASIGARDRLVQLAGGLDKFTSQGEYFLANFFSDQEQAAALRKRIDPTLAQYGLSSEGENASKAFRDFVISLDTTTDAGAKAYTTLMTIAPALKTIIDAGKSALDERKSLQDKYDELTMTSTQLREKERSAVDASNLALYDRVAALQAEKDAASTLLGDVDGAFSILQKVVEREKTAVQTVIDAHTAAVSKLQSLSQSLHSTLNSMMSPDQQVMARTAGQAQIRAALAIAKAGGPLPDAESLKDALSAVSKSSMDQFGSYRDYLKDLYQTQNDIASLGNVTDNQLSVEQKSLAAAQDQLKALDSILVKYQDQIDVLKGQSTTLLSIDQAMQGLSTAIMAAKGNPVVAATSSINDAYQSMLGRAPDATGLAYWQQQAAGGVSASDITSAIGASAEGQVQKAYKDLLGRYAEATGLNYWLKSGSSIDSIRAAIMQSGEYKSLHPFAVGTNFIPEDMPAMVHKGERIIPAADNRALMARLTSPSSNNDALVAEVKALRQEIAQLRTNNSAENVAQVKQLQQTVDLLTRVIYGGDSIQTRAG